MPEDAAAEAAEPGAPRPAGYGGLGGRDGEGTDGRHAPPEAGEGRPAGAGGPGGLDAVQAGGWAGSPATGADGAGDVRPDAGEGSVPGAATAEERAGSPAADAAGAGAGTGRRRPGRLRRWGRRVVATVLALFVSGTLFSFIYNAATAERATAPAGLTYADAAGIPTRYRQWGTTGSPIVLVHGFVESADSWSRLAPVLAARHRVYALDLTGWGYSRRVPPFNAEHDAEQLLGLIDALHLERPVLVGHSTGAAVITAAALRDPSRVGGLVFLDGDGLNTGAGSGAAGPGVLPDPYRTTLVRLAVRSDLLIRTIYDAQCGPGCPRLDRAGIERWRRPLQVPGAENGLWQMNGVVGLPAARIAALGRLRVPKAVIFGADDDVFSRSSPYETARRIGAPPPAVIPGARHLSMISNPAEVAAAIEAMPGMR